jgi:hypothetical protein
MTTATRPRLVQATATHLVVSHRAIMGLLTTLATAGLVLAVVGLREAYSRLPQDGDNVLNVAIAVAVTTVTAVLFIGLVVIPRRVRSTT